MRAWALALLAAACGGAQAPVSAPLVVAPAASAPQPGQGDPPLTERAKDARFRVRIEQSGKDVPIDDHRVSLASDTFTFVFELAQGTDEISVNASYSSHTLELARANAPLTGDEQPFGAGHGAAEAMDEPARNVFVDDDAFNVWGWSGPMHRCHVHQVLASGSVCKRIVEDLTQGSVEAPVGGSGVEALYVVFLAMKHEGTENHELERDWLTMVFESAQP